MSCEIEFLCNDPSIVENFPPIPAKKELPKWFKDLPMTHDVAYDNLKDLNTIKHCMPVQDLVTAGYIIHNTWEFDLAAKKAGPYEDFTFLCKEGEHVLKHHHGQCPVELDSKKKHYFKINNPWRVKTPKGYSTLFIQPLFHFQTDWTMLSGIVDTDQHDMPVSFPGYINPGVDSIHIESGAPLMQLIPFKRDDWTHSVKHHPQTRSRLEYMIKSAYRLAFHKKKRWN